MQISLAFFRARIPLDSISFLNFLTARFTRFVANSFSFFIASAAFSLSELLASCTAFFYFRSAISKALSIIMAALDVISLAVFLTACFLRL